MSNIKEILSIGDRVRITNSYHWAKDGLGTINKPQLTEWLEGYENSCSRDIKSLRGIVTFYWVEFDEPQKDADGDGPYSEAEIESEFLVRLSNDGH